MVALRASSSVVEPATYVNSARVTGFEFGRDKCWFTLSIIPDYPQKDEQCAEPYTVHRLFSDFQYFASYLGLECAKYAEKPPKLTARKRILSSKNSHAERRTDDINEYLSRVFELPLNIRNSTCFAEFFGLWESDMSDLSGTAPTSIDLGSATIPVVSSVIEAFDSLKLEGLPSESPRTSLQRSNTLTSCVSEPPLKLAPWNVRHMTTKEKAAWQSKESTLIRSYSCRTATSDNVTIITPFVRIKVILNAENIVNILVARNISYDDLRKRIFEKFCENQAFKLEDFESVVLAYKRDNSIVVIATNEDLRGLIVDQIDKYVIYLPSSKLLDEFFWMREVADLNTPTGSEESYGRNRDSGYISYRSLSNESLRERYVQEGTHQGHRKQSSLSALRRQDSFGSLKRQSSLSSLHSVPMQNSSLRRQNTMASLHQKTMLASLRRQNSESMIRSKPKDLFDSQDKSRSPENSVKPAQNPSGDSAAIARRVIMLKVVLNSECCVVIPISSNISASALQEVITKAFVQAGYTKDRVYSLQLIHRTADSHFIAVESDEDVRAVVSSEESKSASNADSLSLYLFPRGILTSLRRSGIFLDIPLDAINVT
ncbi:hypothetical protein K493DRAFT_313629 [Basidiobolus meristosporus CBS 931.73]|uniref:PX domain-containing protein n=1 Tax=Basidiobolus meristosporus CBS 931.73 TaxID=1314790 RepID=A0A1Y1YLL1_9FUNG|nr:hypothetical protein K493DRAFT_313629 [Basidiobolus meristosporus CBS 931.73]|eukprot:ORX98474.1 hypothetical protein K493DRAFT_313629 [Basidiobolus meristosporus CBS 931.73]